MSFKVEVSDKFEKDLKRLSKKFPSLKKDYSDLIASLQLNPFQGIPIAHGCYKIRLAIASKGKGKSGGARVVTHVFVTGKVIYLLTIFDKSEQENISDKEILRILNSIR